MATIPDLTIRSATPPYVSYGTITYSQTKLGGPVLPVLRGEDSDILTFRIYNNFALNSGVASAVSVAINCFDGATSASHTALKSAIFQSWIHVYEDMVGESTPSTSYLYTSFTGDDTAIGGNNIYTPELGSNATTSAIIRAGSNTNGLGWIEFKSYARVPELSGSGTTTFVIAVTFQWGT